MQHYLQDFEQFAQSWWPYLLSLLISAISAIRIYFGGKYCESPSRIDGQVVLITGGSSGIGLETAKELAKRGGHIILAIRDVKKGVKAIEVIKKNTQNAVVVMKLLNLSDLTNIRNFVGELKNEYSKIDILINNAGTIAHPWNKSPNDSDLTFITNYLGPFLLTNLLLPIMNKSENGRVINVSASAHFNGSISLEDLNTANGFTVKNSFAVSKLALTIITKYMAGIYADTSITFNSANPGIVRDTGHLEKYSSLSASFFTRISMWPWMWLFLKSPYQGCQTILYLAVEPSVHKVSGYFFSECKIKDPSDLVNDEQLAEALYRKSCIVTDLQIDELPLLNVKPIAKCQETE